MWLCARKPSNKCCAQQQPWHKWWCSKFYCITFMELWKLMLSSPPPCAARMQSCHLFNYRLVQYTSKLFLQILLPGNKTEYLITTCSSLCRKRAESEARKGSLPNNKEMPLHHPTDPVELRRLNFQTPGRLNPQGRKLTCASRSQKCATNRLLYRSFSFWISPVSSPFICSFCRHWL